MPIRTVPRASALLSVFLLAACSAADATPSDSMDPIGGGPVIAVHPCVIDASVAEQLIGHAVDDAQEHLSAMPIEGFVDCVYFDGEEAVAWIAAKQTPTEADEAASVMDELGPALAPDTEATDVAEQVGAPARAYRYCPSAGVCRVAVAVFVAPNVFVASMPDGAGARQGVVALARALAGL